MTVANSEVFESIQTRKRARILRSEEQLCISKKSVVQLHPEAQDHLLLAKPEWRNTQRTVLSEKPKRKCKVEMSALSLLSLVGTGFDT